MGKEGGTCGPLGCLLLGVKEEVPSEGWVESQGDLGRSGKIPMCALFFFFFFPYSPTQP